ncbi:hypothetical protein NUW54_g10491 [Trametes sanguinea]|uniref:Uncharacterized protein n=1 Tax=Trametes sanguinea TaxID=158606 RepID=A0ACC1P1S9_9APHY|nr:hypothetical protein NUW54_g10491 [Trametes sanguinea]
MLPEPLFDVLRAYAALLPPRSIELADVAFGTLHGFLLSHILLNPHFRDFPPSTQYQLLFWKWAIDRLEQSASDPDQARYPWTDEIDERIYTHHVGLIQDLSSQSLGTSAPSPSYVTYLWASNPGPLSRAGQRVSGRGSASLILAQHLLAHPGLIHGRRVLELGCGAGFLAVVAASVQLEKRMAAGSLWLTDVNEHVLSRCEHNLRLRCNQSCHHPNLNFRPLDWFDALSDDRRSSVQELLEDARPDVILGADVVYDPSIIPPLVDVLALALTPREDGANPEAYIALTQRNEDTLANFLHEAGVLKELAIHHVAGSTVADRRADVRRRVCVCQLLLPRALDMHYTRITANTFTPRAHHAAIMSQADARERSFGLGASAHGLGACRFDDSWQGALNPLPFVKPMHGVHDGFAGRPQPMGHVLAVPSDVTYAGKPALLSADARHHITTSPTGSREALSLARISWFIRPRLLSVLCPACMRARLGYLVPM